MFVFAATSRYLQGPSLIDEIGKHAAVLGQRPVIVVDTDVMKLFGERLQRSFEAAGHRRSRSRRWPTRSRLLW